MKLLQQILNAKPHRLIAVGIDASVQEALALMAKHDIGALLVQEDGKPVGIFSERDFARKALKLGMACLDEPVRHLMSEKIISVTLTQTVEECMAIMTDRHIRHLPVTDADGKVVGFLSIGDMVKETISEQSFIIEQLTHYISH
jgi:CBS domain-containing protein